ncbi:MAG TPA: glucose-1-phosphate adenylyltransferase, partial [Planctomycetota bacterium]|nr:glucose-1-phosphate adenylyltransferase [Planctomycetota bacterium]
MPRLRALAMVMAGGKGERLWPLTRVRSKPAVPFGGKYRLIDIVLTNLVNSEIYSVFVLTQYKAQSLIDHLASGWHVLDATGRQFITPVPAQMRTGDVWYRGTSDAIWQNLNLVTQYRPDLVAVFGADHVYRMDVNQMIDFHQQSRADVTISAVPVPVADVSRYGIIVTEAGGRVVGFEEKPAEAKSMPGRPGFALASMGNYIFRREALVSAVNEDASREGPHDFGRSILPDQYKRMRMFAYDFATNEIPGVSPSEERGYWRDVGALHTYYEANMDLTTVHPKFNLYNKAWPLRTAAIPEPPARFISEGVALDSIVAAGSIIRGGVVRRSVVGRGVIVEPGARVEDALL